MWDGGTAPSILTSALGGGIQCQAPSHIVPRAEVTVTTYIHTYMHTYVYIDTITI